MIYRFEDFELDSALMELRAGDTAIATEPQVFALLTFLIEQRDRVVTKNDLLERIWNGRIVSDAAVASRVKSARHAVGDDGQVQRLIRTVHGVGFRFVGDVAVVTVQPQVRSRELSPPEKAPAFDTNRPSIAVLPFRLVGTMHPQLAIADALPHDLITDLARLRWLLVIARASSFRLRGAEANVRRVRDELNVRYCLSGVVELAESAMVVSVELCDTRDEGVVWSDRYRGSIGAVHEIREEIVRAVVNALELHIPLNEARRARLNAPEQLDAWSAYHLGLHHMFRFNRDDNARATALFDRATTLEPRFARAYAGLSFTHFQSAFLGYADDVVAEGELARRFAEQSLEHDPIDPFGNFTMGRAFLLRGDLDACLPWLERANHLNPNYAQARYSHGWVEALRGNAQQSQADVDAALMLSPLDPFVYGMLGVRAFTYMVLGEATPAAAWAERAARSPGAHVLIELVAVAAHGLHNDRERARAWAQSVRVRAPGIDRRAFFRAFPFRDQLVRQRIGDVLARYGF